METQIVKVETTQLEEVVKNSGLAIQEGEEIKQSYIPFLMQLSEIQDQAVKINFEKPTSLDETIARDLRLKTVKIRTGASDLKDSRKRIHLLKGNLEQAAYNLIAASCKLSEETFTSVEKAREIAEAKRQAEAKVIRDAEVLLLAEFIPYGLNLGIMTEEDYQKLLSGAKLQMKAKQDAEIKAEADRLEADRVRIAEEKRIREENEQLKKEAEAKEKQLAVERAKAEQDRKLAEEQARKERDALEAKTKVREEQFKKERIAAEEQARITRERADAILKAERDAKAKLENELKAKAEADAKAKQAIEAEIKSKALAEKKAQAAPDKTKLMQFADQLDALNLPVLNTEEGAIILASTRILIGKTSAYIRQTVKNI